MKLLFPGFKTRALTFSYDDGCVQDRRLVKLFEIYNMKATYNLNSGSLGQTGPIDHRGFHLDFSKVRPEEVASLYQNGEVAMHTVTHPDMTALSQEEFDRQVLDDQKTLQALSGQAVEGLAYPCGLYDDRVLRRLKALGVKYARTTEDSHDFALPEDFLRWPPTCHDHDPLLPQLTRRFFKDDGTLKLFYVWGHSFELDKDDCDRWAALEDFCQSLSGRGDIWYATNLEICDYVTAFRQLKILGGRVFNPSSIPLYVEADGKRQILSPDDL